MIVETDLNGALRKELRAFVAKAFLEEHGHQLGDQPYIDYICSELSKIRRGKERLFLINLPPQHLKTFCAICLIAWYLGHNPHHRVLVIGYSGEHAATISRQVRGIIRSPWYREAFPTRISQWRSSASDFQTKQGGSVYAVSANGSVTGRPADLIVYDDPIQIGDYNNLPLMEKVNSGFDSVIMSRLSNPAKGCVVIVAHRLHEDDISGHVLKEGGYHHICLPLIAPRKKRYDLGHDTWIRRKGELLRPDQYSEKVIARVRKLVTPDFETLYQQNPGGGSSAKVKREYFPVLDLDRMPELPIVLSIDPGFSARSDRSYSVIQLWSPFSGGEHHLRDQFRVHCGLDDLWAALKHFARRTPSAILIENTANGPALIHKAKRFGRLNVIPVSPDGRSKVERLKRHIHIIRDRHIILPLGAEWVEGYLDEISEFPTGPFDDQVDATTQYLDFMAKNPSLSMPPERGVGFASTYSRGTLYCRQPNTLVPGGVWGKGRTWWG
jgi:predicted phage terminase large subunit-like protein